MKRSRIPFNRPFLTGNELRYMQQVMENGRLAGNQIYTRKCQKFLESRYAFQKVLLTTSCTDALEMVAILLDIKPGDEILMPSYTFVSTANAFILRGARIVFVDSQFSHPNINHHDLEELITPKTKAIVVVHYAGMACDMEPIMNLCARYKLYLVEDAAQGIDACYNNKPLGSFGDMATLSFHETKNLHCGEGGALLINNPSFISRAEIIWEKGTNRSAFSRGEVQKYEWVDIGSSFLPSDVSAAFLFAQLENLEFIQEMRVKVWSHYQMRLSPLAEWEIQLPMVPHFAKPNGHIFYLVCRSASERTKLIEYLNAHDIQAVFHYLGLHDSPYYRSRHYGRILPNCKRFSENLIRLPLYAGLTDDDQDWIIDTIWTFYEKRLG